MVTYANKEQAAAAFSAIDGISWPEESRPKLTVSFISSQELQEVLTAKPQTKTTGVKKESRPTKALDELFRKTKAKPVIYWLPLTDEEVAKKTKELKKREQKKRKAQIRSLKFERKIAVLGQKRKPQHRVKVERDDVRHHPNDPRDLDQNPDRERTQNRKQMKPKMSVLQRVLILFQNLTPLLQNLNLRLSRRVPCLRNQDNAKNPVPILLIMAQNPNQLLTRVNRKGNQLHLVLPDRSPALQNTNPRNPADAAAD